MPLKTVRLSLNLHNIICSNICTGSEAVSYSSRVVVNECEPNLYAVLVEWIRDKGHMVRSIIEPYSYGDIPALSSKARFYTFVFLRRRKYSARRLTKAQSMGASLVRVRFSDLDGSTWTWCGLIEDLVELVHGEQRAVLAHMTWLVPWRGELLDDWKDL